jgi:hypothetical protein
MAITIVPLSPEAVPTDVIPVVASSQPGFPCRLCLRDAEVGERLSLFSHAPFDRPGPYRTVGPVYVHAEGCARFAGGEVPLMLRRRLLSLRAYDARDRMLDSDVVEGAGLEELAERLFADERVRVVHVHLARPGCWACSLSRSR